MSGRAVVTMKVARRCARCGKGRYLSRYEQYDGREVRPLCSHCAVKMIRAGVDVEILRNGRRVYPVTTWR